METQIISALWSVVWDKLNASGFTLAQILILIALLFFYYKGFKPLSKTISDIKDKLSDIHNAGWEMQNHLGKSTRGKLEPLHKLNKLTWANSNSPFVLNDRGSRLAEKSGIKDIVSKNLTELIDKVEKTKPISGYDVERCSFEVLGEFIQSNMEFQKQIKDFIFNHPVFEDKEVGLGDIFFVGSIQIREEYFKKHPEIKEETSG